MPVRRKVTGKVSRVAAASWSCDVEPAGYGQCARPERVPTRVRRVCGDDDGRDVSTRGDVGRRCFGGGARTAGLHRGLGPGELGPGRGRGTAAAAADLSRTRGGGGPQGAPPGTGV